MSIKDDFKNSIFNVELTRDELAATIHLLNEHQGLLVQAETHNVANLDALEINHKFVLTAETRALRFQAFKAILIKIESALQAEKTRLGTVMPKETQKSPATVRRERKERKLGFKLPR